MMHSRRLTSLIFAALGHLFYNHQVAYSFSIQPNVWKFRGHPIAYDQATSSVNNANSVDEPAPMLLLNGFGVGSFHQHRLIQSLLEEPTHTFANRKVFAMDYLGQGKSWPENCNDGDSPSEDGLRYSGCTWVDQIVGFLEQVVLVDGKAAGSSKPKKVHLVGNSVGGHLAVFVAALRPDLVASLTLLNATPVWGLNLPGWSGHLPAPVLPKLTGRYLFDRIRDPDTIQTYLEQCYANPEAFDKNLVQQIRSCTENDGGHAAFASILWSPPVTVPLQSSSTTAISSEEEQQEQADFEACLRSVQCDTLLVFGEDDPWCTPAFAKRMLEQLETRGRVNGDDSSAAPLQQRFIGLSQVGHCPNHEAPKAVSRILTRWVQGEEEDGGRLDNFDAFRKQVVVQESWGETVVQELASSEIPLTWGDRIATTFM